MKECYVRLAEHHICKTGKAYWPWRDFSNEEFFKYDKRAGALTLLNRPSRYYLYALAKQTVFIEGDWIECGVYNGGSALLLDNMLYDFNKNKVLNLVDSFEGLPEPSEFDSGKEGNFCCKNVSIVKKDLLNTNVNIFKGWIPEIFNDINVNYFSFAHIDTDFYKPALDCCNFIYPKLTSSGIILFDNYGSPNCKGEKKAVDEFFEDRPETVIPLPTGQAFVIKI